MHGCLGWLLLWPLGGASWLVVKAVNECVKRGNLWRLLGVLLSLAIGGGCAFVGYWIAFEATVPILGWPYLIIGGLTALGGILIALTKTKEEIAEGEKWRKTKKEAKARVSVASHGSESRYSLSQRQVAEAVPPPSLSALQQLHWDKVGIIRHGKSLTEAADILASWQGSLLQPTDRPSYELHNLVLTGRLVTEAALLREESRGAHFRSDFPQRSPEWKRHIVFTARGEGE